MRELGAQDGDVTFEVQNVLRFESAFEKATLAF